VIRAYELLKRDGAKITWSSHPWPDSFRFLRRDRKQIPVKMELTRRRHKIKRVAEL
jgi:hypothetical protein